MEADASTGRCCKSAQESLRRILRGFGSIFQSDTSSDSKSAIELAVTLPSPAAPPRGRNSCVARLESSSNCDLALHYTTENGVATISLGDQASEDVLPWGTKAEEHRLYPELVLALLGALDRIAEDVAVQALVVTASGRFWSNGFDLKWIQQHPDMADALQQVTEVLCARLLKFPKPTVAAVNGHAAAAGAMLLLSFDVKVMNSTKGFCFVPGIDLGLVYSPGMTALMVAKLPQAIRHDFIVFGQRYTAQMLAPHGVVNAAVPAEAVLETAVTMASELKPKAKHPATMARIKETLYHEAIAALECEPDEMLLHPTFTPMGFDALAAGVDRPVARRQNSCAIAQQQVKSDLIKLSQEVITAPGQLGDDRA